MGLKYRVYELGYSDYYFEGSLLGAIRYAARMSAKYRRNSFEVVDGDNVDLGCARGMSFDDGDRVDAMVERLAARLRAREAA